MIEVMFIIRTEVTSTHGGLKICLPAADWRHTALKIMLREGEAEHR